ncbi:MAG TPA: hypothetical protein VFB12_30380 [Ktedonobacteraceae bacterium]|nr:hypothetical protein [Ktedonobacteraceae bacterium]
MKVIKSIYDFIVGDMIILVGVVITILVLALIENVRLAPLQTIAGALLIIAVLGVLFATLTREARGKR